MIRGESVEKGWETHSIVRGIPSLTDELVHFDGAEGAMLPQGDLLR